MELKIEGVKGTLINLVFCRDGNEVGKAIVKDGYQLHIMTFSIKKAYRERGLGSEALNKLCERFKKAGHEKIYVDPYLSGPYKFFEKNGFKILDVESPNVYMSRDL